MATQGRFVPRGVVLLLIFSIQKVGFLMNQQLSFLRSWGRRIADSICFDKGKGAKKASDSICLIKEKEASHATKRKSSPKDLCSELAQGKDSAIGYSDCGMLQHNHSIAIKCIFLIYHRETNLNPS